MSSKHPRRVTNHWLNRLGVDGGVVATVGAGGKKTTIYRIADRYPGRIGITTTVFLAPFPDNLDAERVLVPSDSPSGELVNRVVAASRRSRIVAFAHESEKKARYGGLTPAELQDVQDQASFDLLLVKADGARMRSIKAPAPDEPLLPNQTDAVLYLVSSRALGRPLDEDIAHRVEQIEQVTGARRGEPITPLHVARLLSSEHGALQGIGSARMVPIINLYNDLAHIAEAREIAQTALAMTDRFDRVVLAQMNCEDPIIDVIART